MDIRGSVLGFRAHERFRGHIARIGLARDAPDLAPITAEELGLLPEPVQRYLGFMGVAEGRPRDWSFTTRFRGRFRMKRGQAWMPFDAWQYNRSDPVTRVIDMRIDAIGLVPMFGTDSYVAGRGRMIGRLLGLVPVASGEGEEFDLGELVTYLDDALMLAPSMLLRSSTDWRPVDDHAFDVELTDGSNRVLARAFVDDEGRLLDVRTEDRWFSGTTPPTRTPWTTPVTGWTRLVDGRRQPIDGAAVWHLPDGDLAYVSGAFDPADVRFNIGPTQV